MTEDQKIFLVHNSVNEEAVREGRLREWQIHLLHTYDFCLDYLADRYPEHDFIITTYENTRAFTKFIVIPDNDEDRVFTVNVFEDENGYAASDYFA